VCKAARRSGHNCDGLKGQLFRKLNRLTVMTSFSKFVSVLFSNKNLLLTNLSVSAGLSGLGDVLIQHHERTKTTNPAHRWNLTRSCHMGVSFGLTSGFFCHYWYNFLDKKIPGKSIGIITRKILYDQVLFSPFLIVACLAVAGVIEASSRQDIVKDIKEKGARLYLAEWFIWPPAQFVNFYFLPTRFRVIYDNIISLGYDMYTSHVKHEKTAQPETEEDEQEQQDQQPKPDKPVKRLPTKLESYLLSITNSKAIWSLNLNFDTGE